MGQLSQRDENALAGPEAGIEALDNLRNELMPIVINAIRAYVDSHPVLKSTEVDFDEQDLKDHLGDAIDFAFQDVREDYQNQIDDIIDNAVCIDDDSCFGAPRR